MLCPYNDFDCPYVDLDKGCDDCKFYDNGTRPSRGCAFGWLAIILVVVFVGMLILSSLI